MKTLGDIRSTFLNYFKDKGHEVVPSSSLIPHNDPTLLFTTAGMVQFKDVFTGLEKRPYTRATSAQKCVRAGGKHNDLENVGYTARHHTFFEMLGNFSFGDYFKEEAILYAWELITKDFMLSKDKLWFTVYAEDEESATLWRKITGCEDSRILRISTSDNFWSMGDTGPCGPCTEIFYDHGENIPGGLPGTPDEDGDRYMEIWNLVFMQYEQLGPDKRVNLPKPSVDTGMGLERIGSILQGQHDNYDTDLFKAIIETSQSLSHDTKHTNSHRVIADHLRSSSFLIADGILPSNEGRGYVLRRIMRRAMRHAHIIGCKEPLMHRLVPILTSQMGESYPELKRAEALIKTTLFQEEERFQQTLGKGIKLLQGEIDSLQDNQKFPGATAFKLYDTYGFPLDLTQDILKASHKEVDIDAFNKVMEEQKAKARASWVGSGEAAFESIWYDLAEKHGSTEFLGYTSLVNEAVVLALVEQNGQHWLVTSQTPFYAESGGQVGDIGHAKIGDKDYKILDTQKKVGRIIAHLLENASGIKEGDKITLYVDGEHRSMVKANHTATHLLHSALRRFLGDHVTQKGSLVHSERLRFDFSHSKPLTPEEIEKIEEFVNTQIQLHLPVQTVLMDTESAIKEGAMALFGEKYDQEVRTVRINHHTDVEQVSFELCGGTHVENTGAIGLFKIINEAGVASGIRRIEALTSKGALAYVRQMDQQLKTITSSLKCTREEANQRIEGLIEDRKKLQQQLASFQTEHLKKQLLGSKKTVQDTNLFVFHAQNIPSSELKGVVDQVLAQENGLVVLSSTVDDKVSIVVGVHQSLTSKYNAGEIVKNLTPLVGGQGGGGRPDMAQGGGTDPKGLSQVSAYLDGVV